MSGSRIPARRGSRGRSPAPVPVDGGTPPSGRTVN